MKKNNRKTRSKGGISINSYENALTVMNELFAKDFQFALATASNNIPSLRFIDTYFDGEFFYAITHSDSEKMKEIAINPNVALCCDRMYSFSGKARSIAHPLSPVNTEIRKKLVTAFESWYFNHNDENDECLCILQIEPNTGFIHKNGIGYKINFIEKTAEEFPFSLDIVYTNS